MKSILLLSIAVAVQAANQIVQVAPSGSFTYSPNSVTAAVGDTIEFQFESNVSHLWHSSFAEPLCRSSVILESMSAAGWRYSPVAPPLI
jgi:plastocyanin